MIDPRALSFLVHESSSIALKCAGSSAVKGTWADFVVHECRLKDKSPVTLAPVNAKDNMLASFKDAHAVEKTTTLERAGNRGAEEVDDEKNASMVVSSRALGENTTSLEQAGHSGQNACERKHDLGRRVGSGELCGRKVQSWVKFVLCKMGVDTISAVRTIAQTCGVHYSRFKFAGIKVIVVANAGAIFHTTLVSPYCFTFM